MDLSDEQLMAMFRHGNRSAFELLFERHRRGVFNFALRMTGERAAAEDACQETFLRVVTGAATYRPEGRFRAWLFRIARNCCLKTLRRRFGPQIEMERFAAPQEGPAAAASRAETQQRLEAAILRLPGNWREVFLLRYRHGMEYQEIAEVTEQPLGTVKTHIHRARMRLADEIHGESRGLETEN
jgi:RNA polymerase sigma-70 factor (ECF subfamily)